jgi:hypothetical protein
MPRTKRRSSWSDARWLSAVVLLLCLLAPLVASAQDKPPVGTAGSMTAEEKAMMDAMVKAGTPGPNHELLTSVVGDWTFKNKMWMDPSAPPTESTGTASYASLYGGRYVEGTYKGDMMGMQFEGKGLMGYDNVSQKFQSTWADNMGTMIMFMTGEYDPATKTITYKGQMNDLMKPGTQVTVRQVVRLTSPDSHVMEWFETRGGKETKMMEITYSRAR